MKKLCAVAAGRNGQSPERPVELLNGEEDYLDALRAWSWWVTPEAEPKPSAVPPARPWSREKCFAFSVRFILLFFASSVQ